MVFVFPVIEPTMIMRAPFTVFISGRRREQSRKWLRWLICNCCSKPSSVNLG